MSKIYDISLQLEILQKNKEKLHNKYPNVFSKSENESFLNEQKKLNEHIHILLKYIGTQKSDQNIHLFKDSLKSFLKK